jgi:hypothetical protein
MTPDHLLRDVVDPALAYMSATLSGDPCPSVGDDARVALLAIAGQESGFKERRQIGGPARSYWQFESGGGVAGVMGFPTTRPMLVKLCAGLDIPYVRATVFEAMAWNDRLGCAMARFLLYTDAAALPAVGQQDAMWDYYLRNWRPGKPHPEAWPANYRAATAAVAASRADRPVG